MRKDPIRQELERLLVDQQFNDTYHQPPEAEFDYYRRIAMGDDSILDEPMEHIDAGKGILSENKLRNFKYHTIILIAMISRFCRERGLSGEKAYTLSDMFILRVDKAQDSHEIEQIKYDMLKQYISLMKELKSNQALTYQVRKAIEYIDQHITGTIRAEDVARVVGSSPDYLSRLFKKETGMNLVTYINNRKCETACYLLESSDISCTDIASFLGYASCSHFIDRFKVCKGITPGDYRTNFKNRDIDSII